MKILIFGSNGQLGSYLCQVLEREYKTVHFRKDQLDIRNIAEVEPTVEDLRPDVIINAAAYTRVDEAENNREEAFEVNAQGPKNLANLAKSYGAKLIHYSTDYVFNGSSVEPYKETSVTDPINFYGKTKLVGEDFIKEVNCSYLIFRTSWVIGNIGNNFANKIIDLAINGRELKVVDDQFGSPTSVGLITKVTKEVISKFEYGDPWPDGIYNLTAKGSTSWHNLAVEILKIAERLGLPLESNAASVRPVPSGYFPTPARRPMNSVLDTDKIKEYLSFELPRWQDDVRPAVTHLVKRKQVK